MWQLNENGKAVVMVFLVFCISGGISGSVPVFCFFELSHVISMLRKAQVHCKSKFSPPELQPLAKMLYQALS